MFQLNSLILESYIENLLRLVQATDDSNIGDVSGFSKPSLPDISPGLDLNEPL